MSIHPLQPRTRLTQTRHHLWEDLAPFLCLYEECGTADVPYTSKHTWLEHIRANHLRPVWTCPWCAGGNKVFDTDSAFRDHIRLRHNTAFSEAEMSLITKSNQRSQPFECCLICGLSDGLSDGREDTPKTAAGRQGDIISCMVNHLEVLALESIPWHIGDMGDARSDEAENTDHTVVAAGAAATTEAGHDVNESARVGGVHETDSNKNAEDSAISGDLDPTSGLMYRGDLGSITSSAAPSASLKDRITTWLAQDAQEEQRLGSAPEIDEKGVNEPNQSSRKRHKIDAPEHPETTHSAERNVLRKFSEWLSFPRVKHTGIKDFVPDGEIDAYLRRDHTGLKEILAVLFPNESDRPSADHILQFCLLVFAILVSSGDGDWIGMFLKHKPLYDSSLPFRMDGTESEIDDAVQMTYTVPLAHAPFDTSLTGAATSRSSDGFPRSLFERFRASQARFCAPKFTEGHSYRFDADTILPYLERQLIGEGGGAEVYRVKVHANHDFMRRLDSGHSDRFDRYDTLPYLEKQLIGEGASAKVYRVKVDPNHDRLDTDVRIPRVGHRTKYLILFRHPRLTATTL